MTKKASASSSRTTAAAMLSCISPPSSGAGWHRLQQDQRLAYDVVLGQRGKSEAANLRTVEDDQAGQDNAPAEASSEESSEVTAEATSGAPAAD